MPKKFKIPSSEEWDPKNEIFINTKDTELLLEHSLVSISKWEAKHCKPFLSETPMTQEEFIDYIRCMTISQGIDPNVYYAIPSSVKEEINEYIKAPMTATWFNDTDKKKTSKKEVITNEIIYYWMIALQVPMECEKWHLNRLLTLIQVCNIKNSPPKKMTKKEIMSRNKALNEARKKSLASKR